MIDSEQINLLFILDLQQINALAFLIFSAMELMSNYMKARAVKDLLGRETVRNESLAPSWK